ncbi:lipoate--protein ligase family protein [Lapidilactobacillus wuchangensis]|uniref:lipoate--protein ligase family protein n=1 Tax=Lapidilactobacillus wuchangensis TaxID=2486001 RepID=UPI000F7B40EC|nr:lipoate--protein ligase family protein [Lapidilactobacillus wuchangensis]
MLNELPQLLDFYQTDYSVADRWLPFAETQLLLQFVNQTQRPLLHYWTLPQTVILGLRDQRLPQITAGLNLLQQQGWHYFYRNSGGLGVVSDAGVLNVSLCLPATIKLTITEGYQLMSELVQSCWPTLPIQTGEISQSYCPGTYDLSIAGRKIAGIAQRRSRGATAIMLYLSVTGTQQKRSELMAQFYRASQGQPPDFPEIDPQVMANLADFLPAALTVDLAQQQLSQTLRQAGHELSTTAWQQFCQQPNFKQQQQQAWQNLASYNQSIL